MDTQRGPRSLMKLVFGLGLTSVLLILLSVIAGLSIPAIGIVSFLPLAMLSGLAGIVIWLSGKNRRKAATPREQRLGRIGFILGCCGLGIAILIRLLVFVFFLPWLNR